MTSPRERAARRLYEREPIFYHPAHPPFKTGEIPWDAPDAEPWRDRYFRIVDAVLDEIREPGNAALVDGAATIPECIEFFRKTHALRCHTAMIDAIKRGEG